MIKDLITKKEYEGKKCIFCGSDNIYILHTINKDFPNDIEKDYTYCRCESCRNSVLKDESQTQEKDRYFNSYQDAINMWNETN